MTVMIKIVIMVITLVVMTADTDDTDYIRRQQKITNHVDTVEV